MAPIMKASAPIEALAGVVERVTFHNGENGFCVLRVKARSQRDLITILGHAATVSAGEFVQASGSWINDRTHGVQFRASFLKATPPTTTEGIEKYLGSGLIRGIGVICSEGPAGVCRQALLPAMPASSPEQGPRALDCVAPRTNRWRAGGS